MAITDSKFLSLTGLQNFWKGAKSYIDTLAGTKLTKDATVNGQSFTEGAATINGTHIMLNAGAGASKSIDAAISELVAIKHVNSIDNYSGKVSLKKDNIGDGQINLAISERGEISASIIGLQAGAYADDAAGLNVGGTGAYSDGNIQTAIDSLDKAIQAVDAKSGVVSINGRAGEIKIDTAAHTNDGNVTFALGEDNTLKGSVDLSAKVDNTRKINGSDLTSDVTLTGTVIEVGANGGNTYKTQKLDAAIKGIDDRLIAEETMSHVNTIDGKSGAFTFAPAVGNGTVQLAASDENVLSATINGLKSAAYTDSTDYAKAVHTHEMKDIADLSAAMDLKANVATTINTHKLEGDIVLNGTELNVGSGTHSGKTVAAAIEAIEGRLVAEENKAYVESVGGKSGALTFATAASSDAVQLAVSDQGELSATLKDITTAKVTGLDTALGNKAEKSDALKSIAGDATADGSNVTVSLTPTCANDQPHKAVTIKLPVAGEEAQGTITEKQVKILAKAQAEAVATSSFKVKGSKTNFSELTLEGNTVGDVWNIINAFEIGKEKYLPGTNVVWEGSKWDALGGTVDLTLYETVAKSDEKLAKKANADAVVSLFGGQVGEITVKGDNTADAPGVNLSISTDKQLKAVLVGLGNGASTNFVEITDAELDALPGLTGLIIEKQG